MHIRIYGRISVHTTIGTKFYRDNFVGETSDEALHNHPILILIFILGWQEFEMKSKLSWHQSLY